MSNQREILLQVNSHDRTNLNESQSKFTVSLGKDERISSVKAIAIKALQCTNSFYNIDYYNNTFYYDTGGSELSVVIPRGQYNITTFVEALQAGFSAQSVSLTIIDDPLTHKLNFTASPPISFYRKRPNGELNPIHRVVGIREGTGFNNPVASYSANAIHDLTGIKSLYILSNILGGGYMQTSRNGGSKMAVLDVLPVRVPFGGIMHHEDRSIEIDSRSYDNILQNNLSSIDIELRDSENHLLDTNGLDIVIVLKVFY